MSGLYCLILGLVGGFDAWLTVRVVLRTTLLLVAAAYYINVFGTIILITKSCHHFRNCPITMQNSTYQCLNNFNLTLNASKPNSFV
ncbi:MAG: hypothetical protein F9K37_05605 [Bacteroidales bacterium]|nr:MAG: hypothetical protein F9K37_05605 [Bacteroidales bacterium]